jgi:hypothetical protein
LLWVFSVGNIANSTNALINTPIFWYNLQKGYSMRLCLVILSFFLLGCQVVDTIAVPINNTANNLSNSSNLYEDNQTNTSLHMGKSGLVLEKEF